MNPDWPARARRGAGRAALSAAALNGLAAAAMLVCLAPGMPVPGSTVEVRHAFLVEHAALWIAGWLAWHAAAIALLGFYLGLALVAAERSPILALLAPLLAAAGLCADLAAQALYIGSLGRIEPGADFVAAERAIEMLTGYLGNGLYTLAGISLVVAARDQLPRSLVALAVPTFGAGLVLSAACVADVAALKLVSTAILMPLVVIWCALVGRWLLRPSS